MTSIDIHRLAGGHGYSFGQYLPVGAVVIITNENLAKINTRPKRMNWDRLYLETYREMDCDDLSAVVAGHRGLKRKDLEKRTKKQRDVQGTLSRFRSAMESPNPPATKEEAVASLSPIVAYLLWSVFKMLAIKVIEWAWDRYAEQQQELAAGKA